MGLSKRSRLVVLVLMVTVAALLVSSRGAALAGEPYFLLLPVGDESGASGEAYRLEDRSGWSRKRPMANRLYLSVSCQGLTPGATYRVDYGGYWAWVDTRDWQYYEAWDDRTFCQAAANKKGALECEGGLWYTWSPYSDNPLIYASWLHWEEYVLVYRVEPSEDVLVLEGGCFWSNY